MMHTAATRWGKLVLGGLLGTLALGALVVGVILFEQHKRALAGAAVAKAAATAPPAARPTRVGAEALLLPPGGVRSLAARTGAVAPGRPRSLPPFAGTLALDNDRLARVHTRFAGEVMALGTPADGETTEPTHPGSVADRPLAVG